MWMLLFTDPVFWLALLTFVFVITYFNWSSQKEQKKILENRLILLEKQLEEKKGTGEIYSIRIEEDGTSRVIFGDGVAGANLHPDTIEIDANYRDAINNLRTIGKKVTKVFVDRKQMIKFLVKRITDELEEKINEESRDSLILQVWEEEISGFQIPSLLIEPALGGPDQKYCDSCKTLNDKKAIFCDNCGKKLPNYRVLAMFFRVEHQEVCWQNIILEKVYND